MLKTAILVSKWPFSPKVVGNSVTDSCAVSVILTCFILVQLANWVKFGPWPEFRASGAKYAPVWNWGLKKTSKKVPFWPLFARFSTPGPPASTPKSRLFGPFFEALFSALGAYPVRGTVKLRGPYGVEKRPRKGCPKSGQKRVIFWSRGPPTQRGTPCRVGAGTYGDFLWEKWTPGPGHMGTFFGKSAPMGQKTQRKSTYVPWPDTPKKVHVCPWMASRP